MAIAFLVIVILVMGYAWLIMPRMTVKSDIDKVTVDYAHRGLFSNEEGVPENSHAAFKYAVMGEFGIELDVQLTADGEVVVFHDYDLKRMCGKDVKLSELTLKELREYTLIGTKHTIPTLKEVLKLVNGRVPLLVELKGESGNTAVCSATAEILDGYCGAYCVESFNPLLLRWFKKNRSKVVRGQLVTSLIKNKFAGNVLRNFALSALLTNFLSRPDFIAVDQKCLRDISVRICGGVFGSKIFVWTVTKREHFDINRENGDYSIFEGFNPLDEPDSV